MIDWFFRISGYKATEYYDVAAIGYLKAVKSWFNREELHKYEFSTIARNSMRSYIGNDIRKTNRRIQTISLDAQMGEDDSFCYMDTITYDNYSNCYVS